MVFRKYTGNYLLGKIVNLQIEIGPFDFTQIMDISKQEAKRHCADPMLLSWYDGNTGAGYPNLECGKGDKPSWILYAESRGADITININNGEFVFIFLSFTKMN